MYNPTLERQRPCPAIPVQTAYATHPHFSPPPDRQQGGAKARAAAPERNRRVNAYEQLVSIRDRLEQNGASEDSVNFVERFIKRAEPERDVDMSVTQSVMIRHLLRQREALDNYTIYDDLQELVSEMENRRSARDEDGARPAWQEERAPRPKSYYKSLKERDQQR